MKVYSLGWLDWDPNVPSVYTRLHNTYIYIYKYNKINYKLQITTIYLTLSYNVLSYLRHYLVLKTLGILRLSTIKFNFKPHTYNHQTV